MSSFMYILECADGTYYTGSTVNLEKRLWEHGNSLGANYTKKRQPVKLVYLEEYPRIDEAFSREKQVQGWSRAKKKALIESRYKELPKLSECRNESHYKNAPFDSAQGAAFDSAQGAAFDSAQGAAFDSAQGAAFDSAQGAAFDSAQGTNLRSLSEAVIRSLSGVEMSEVEMSVEWQTSWSLSGVETWLFGR